MAEQNPPAAAAAPEAEAPEDQHPHGAAWDVVGTRRLLEGDVIRLRVERGGRRVLMDIGADHPSRAGVVRWHYQITMPPAELMQLAGDLLQAGLHVERSTLQAFRRLVERGRRRDLEPEAPEVPAPSARNGAEIKLPDDLPGEPVAGDGAP